MAVKHFDLETTDRLNTLSASAQFSYSVFSRQNPVQQCHSLQPPQNSQVTNKPQATRDFFDRVIYVLHEDFLGRER